MKVILLNGSPRGERSNSQVMLRWLVEGYGRELPLYHLHHESLHPQAIKATLEAEVVFLILPLYVDSMPGQVMKFLEDLEKHREKLGGRSIGAIIHSGFPEGSQSFILREILEGIFEELGLNCLGIAIRGGSEGTRLMPDLFQRGSIKAVREIGRALSQERPWPESALRNLSHPITLSRVKKLMMQMGSLIGLSNFYWNRQLKANGVLKESFAKPYLDENQPESAYNKNTPD